eukprot:1160790-Pelagomonas_calceolata.AAC.3
MPAPRCHPKNTGPSTPPHALPPINTSPPQKHCKRYHLARVLKNLCESTLHFCNLICDWLRTAVKPSIASSWKGVHAALLISRSRLKGMLGTTTAEQALFVFACWGAGPSLDLGGWSLCS